MSIMMRILAVLVQVTLVIHAQPNSMFEKHADDGVLGHGDLQNTTLGFMVGLPQNKKTFRAPTHNPRLPHERPESGRGKGKHGIAEFQNEEKIRLLNLLLDLDTAGANIASFQAQERARLRSFQDQERARLQVEAQALRSFQAQERVRLLGISRSLGSVGQSLGSFQDQERSRLQADLRALAEFQDQERLRLQSLGRALNAINAPDAPLGETSDVMAADHMPEALPDQKSDLLGHTSPGVTSSGAVLLASILAVSSVTFAVLRSRRSFSLASEEPLLV